MATVKPKAPLTMAESLEYDLVVIGHKVQHVLSLPCYPTGHGTFHAFYGLFVRKLARPSTDVILDYRPLGKLTIYFILVYESFKSHEQRILVQ